MTDQWHKRVIVVGKRGPDVARPFASKMKKSVRRCRVCGCTDADCSGCVERTGRPCLWVAPDLCSACQDKG